MIRPEDNSTFPVGIVASISFEDNDVALAVGRLDRDALGPSFEGAKVVGIRNHTGTHLTVVDDETIDELIALLHKLKRSEGHEKLS